MKKGKEERSSFMGHYCRICGRTRANEKFSGKGHKNHVCKDCFEKSGRKTKKNSIDENAFASETTVLLNDMPNQPESMYFDDNWFFEIDLEKQIIDDENGEELPF
jgi:ribosome-binding protein aMBF1 (putative translation factor)